MITMRSMTKMTKPPPPVPPRPSKTVVAEALAKRRRVPEDTNTVPVRSAPPPPSDLSRSNFSLKRTSTYERSISEELKSNSRTLIFQSSNMKSSNNNNNLLVRNDSFDKKVTVNNSYVNQKDDQKVQEPEVNEEISTNEVTVNSQIVTCVISSENEGFKEVSGSPDGTMGNPVNDEKWDGILKDKNHVNKLIDEMFAGVLEASNVEETKREVEKDCAKITINNKYESPSCGTTVLIIEGSDTAPIAEKSPDACSDKSNSSTMEKKSVKFDDKKNAEFLIEELESMRMEQEKIMKRQRKPSSDIYDTVEGVDYERLKTMSSLHGLPPLPKSLSGFNLDEHYPNPQTPARSAPSRGHQGQQPSSFGPHVAFHHYKGANGSSDLSSGRKSTSMDAQLAILKREMYSLRQLDLSLLSQLWSLNESIQDFRQILQEQEECRVLSPPSPSPAASSGDEGDADEQFYVNATTVNPSVKFRPAPPPPPLRRSSNSSNASTGA